MAWLASVWKKSWVSLRFVYRARALSLSLLLEDSRLRALLLAELEEVVWFGAGRRKSQAAEMRWESRGNVKGGLVGQSGMPEVTAQQSVRGRQARVTAWQSW